MHGTLFATNYFMYGILDWPTKKEKILDFIKGENLLRDTHKTFLSDRDINQNEYKQLFLETCETELDQFKQEAKLPRIDIKSIWTAKYEKGDFHPVHNHSGKGYSGILYLEYDEEEHDGTWFVSPTNNPVNDRTEYTKVTAYEGCIVIAPSNILHFTFPNTSDKPRTIIGFDLEV